jgi:nitrate reductase beta subunit
MGNRAMLLGKIFANPHLPGIDDYYEPFDYDYQNLHNAPESKHQPIARPRSLITGQRMDKITSGPNWEDSGRRVRETRKTELREHAEGDVRPVRKHLHDVSAAPVRALPEPGVRGDLPERRHLQT